MQSGATDGPSQGRLAPAQTQTDCAPAYITTNNHTAAQHYTLQKSMCNISKGSPNPSMMMQHQLGAEQLLNT